MEKDQLRKFIVDSIHSVAFNELRNKKQAQPAKPVHEELSEDDIDTILFYGGKRPEVEGKKNTITIKESQDKGIRIMTSEITEFEDSFKQLIQSISNATIVFDKQNNGYSLVAYKRPDGIEMLASGTIDLGRDGKVIWSYSLQNGITITAQNLKLSQDNKALFEQLFNNYNDWQKKWREKLSLPSGEQKADNTIPPGAPEPSTMGQPPAQSPQSFL